MSEEVRHEKIAIGAMQVTRQTQIANGDTLAFVFPCDATAEAADVAPFMNMIDVLVQREKARVELPARREHLEVLRLVPSQIEEAVANLRKEQAALVAGWHARHQIRGKRADFAETPPQTAQREEIEKKIADQMKLLTQMPDDIVAAEWEVVRREAIIAGQPEPPRPPKIAEKATMLRLQEAAD